MLFSYVCSGVPMYATTALYTQNHIGGYIYISKVMATESPTCDDDIKSFDVTSLSQWLAESGIPEEVFLEV